MSDDYDAIVLGGGAPERLWAIGGVTGVWQLAHMGEYEGEVVASNILGETREAHYEAVPRVTYTDPQAAAAGATEAPFSATVPLSDVARTATYTHAYADSNGFLTLLSDGQAPSGAYASFSEIHAAAVKALRRQIAAGTNDVDGGQQSVS
jgi:hypothetical protein